MSFFKRMTNLAKGTLATAGPERGSAALETLLKEQALEEELAKPPAPTEAARDALEALKTEQGSGVAAPAATGASSLEAELSRLKQARRDGLLTEEELEKKTAAAVARSEADRRDDLPPPERPLRKTL